MSTETSFPKYPAIGIRPVIDGRLGGVRENLEDTTLSMARRTADFYRTHLKYPDGTPVRCVVPDFCIGRVPESAACADLFARERVGISLTVTPCWCYGTETIDTDPLRPKAIWGFNGTERPGAVYLAAALAGHNQSGLPAFGIYGREVQDAGDERIPEDVRERLLLFGRAGLAVVLMRGYSYLAIGGVSMGIAGSVVNPDFFQSYLGMRNEFVDSSEVLRRIEGGIYDPEEYEKAMAWTSTYCKSNEGKDFNPDDRQKEREELDEDWEFVVKMTLVIKDLMRGNDKLAELGYGEEALGHNAIVSGFQGQRQWTDFKPNGDFSEAILNSSFDWNGARSPLLTATENDSLNGVVMLFGQLMTHTAQIFADVRTYWSKESVARVTGYELTGRAEHGIIHMINSGSAALDATGRQEVDGQPVMKPFYDLEEAEIEACLEHTTWHPAMLEYFRGGGFSSGMLSRGGMPLTMTRINLIRGLGPALQIAEGWSVDLPEDVHAQLNDRTNPTWPTTWFAPRLTGEGPFQSVYSVMDAWGANHCSMAYGHVGAEFITLAAMLRIPVCLHNVSADRIFRPDAWRAFGMDTEGSDYRACSTYGPRYSYKR